jgi:tetratricopeptide (TPR) repeat protein
MLQFRILTALLAFALGACASTPEGEFRAGEGAVERGDPSAAAAHWEAALELAETTPIPSFERMRLLYELGNLYVTYPELQAEGRGLELLERARDRALAEWPPKHPWRLEILETLGNAYTLAGRWPEAAETLETFLKEAQGRTDPESLYRSQPAQNLLSAYRALGEEEKAAQLKLRQEDPFGLALVEGMEVLQVPASELFLAPNVVDTDGTPALVHFTQADMPLRVSMGENPISARDQTAEETARLATRSLQIWEKQIRRLYPWFELTFVDSDPDAAIQVEWQGRGRYFLPAYGEIFHRIEGDRLRVQGRLTLAPQPIPSQDTRVEPGEFALWVVHSAGRALGLPDCWNCDSVMAMDFLRRADWLPTTVDLRSFEALMEAPNGIRVDGQPLAGLPPTGELPPVGLSAIPPPREGVLADLPFINNGRGDDIVVDLSPNPERPLPLLLDTGATTGFMSLAYARAAGVATRKIKSDQNRRPTVTGQDFLFWVDHDRHSDMHYALLGGEYLMEYVVELDFGALRVRLLDPEIHRLDDERSRDPGETVLPLQINERRPYVELQFEGGSVFALIDTGAEAPIVMTEEKALELGIEIDRNAERRRGINVVGTSTELVQHLPELSLGSVVLKDVELLIGIRDESSARVTRWLQHETILGNRILMDYRVRFDYQRGLLSLTPIARPEG